MSYIVLYCDYSVGIIDKNYLFIPAPSRFPDAAHCPLRNVYLSQAVSITTSNKIGELEQEKT
jgi:hypothetical protein